MAASVEYARLLLQPGPQSPIRPPCRSFEAASRDGPLEHRRAILKEWRDWNATEGAGDDIHPFFLGGLGVAVRFDQPIDGRNFMNRIYDSSIERMRAETRH